MSRMVFEIIIYSICLVALVIGTVTDIKTREVPDWLNYSLIAIGLGLGLIRSIVNWDYIFLLYSFLGFLVFFLIGLFMFYTGQWGGGDSKMVMGLGALLGLTLSFDSFLVAFFINMLLAGALYGIVWSLILLFRHKKKFVKEIKKVLALKQVILTKKILFWSLFLFIILTLLIRVRIVQIQLLALFILAVGTLYLWIFVKAVENSCMFRYVEPVKLTEGDWIAKDVKVNGKKICGPKDLGISKKQIQLLVKFYKQNKVKRILIKEGIPFVPSFLIAFIVTLIFGNLLFMVF